MAPSLAEVPALDYLVDAAQRLQRMASDMSLTNGVLARENYVAGLDALLKAEKASLSALSSVLKTRIGDVSHIEPQRPLLSPAAFQDDPLEKRMRFVAQEVAILRKRLAERNAVRSFSSTSSDVPSLASSSASDDIITIAQQQNESSANMRLVSMLESKIAALERRVLELSVLEDKFRTRVEEQASQLAESSARHALEIKRREAEYIAANAMYDITRRQLEEEKALRLKIEEALKQHDEALKQKEEADRRRQDELLRDVKTELEFHRQELAKAQMDLKQNEVELKQKEMELKQKEKELLASQERADEYIARIAVKDQCMDELATQLAATQEQVDELQSQNEQLATIKEAQLEEMKKELATAFDKLLKTEAVVKLLSERAVPLIKVKADPLKPVTLLGDALRESPPQTPSTGTVVLHDFAEDRPAPYMTPQCDSREIRKMLEERLRAADEKCRVLELRICGHAGEVPGFQSDLNGTVVLSSQITGEEEIHLMEMRLLRLEERVHAYEECLSTRNYN